MLRCGSLTYTPRLVIFDKDGTLIAFETLWHAWYRRLAEALDEAVCFTPTQREELTQTLGIDAATGAWDPEGPLTLASTGEALTLISGLLYRAGHTWPAAQHLTQQAAAQARQVLREENLLQPVGDVARLLRSMRETGLHLAVATADDREPTERQLAHLGISTLLDTWVCGDDGVPLKPAPDMVLEICERVGVKPCETLVVGDTIGDLEMAHSAGCLAAVGVLSGAVPEALLRPYADTVLSTIQSIAVLNRAGEAIT